MYFTQSLHRALTLYPTRIAVRDGERQWTFQQYGERVTRMAGALRALGMSSGDRVAMLALNSYRYLECNMAVPWAGGVINPCNTRWSVAELVYALDDSGSHILFVDDTFAPVVAQIKAQSQSLRTVIYCGDGATPEGMLDYEALIASTEPVDDALRRGEDLLSIFYTGGTTGFPKGVMFSHNNNGIGALAAMASGLGTRDGSYLHAAPMFHVTDFGLASPHWLAGNAHTILRSFTPESALKAIERDGITDTVMVPTMIQMMVDHLAANSGYDLSSLKTLAYGASPMPETLLRRAIAVLPGVGFVQLYGMTEMGPLTVNPADYHPGKLPLPEKLDSAGKPRMGIELKIVDEQGADLPRNTVGEIVARGATLMQGYWNNEEQTKEAVRDGWYRTGDGGYLDDDGYVYIVDRMKDMIVSGGENVYSAEVENAVLKHPNVAQCAVIAVPSAQWGEAVHACVVLRAGETMDVEELREHCRRHIAGYKCPRSVEVMAALPVSGAGKVLKNRLREPHWKNQQRNVA
jgi:acyl-CoA synthetase (AMP-forming)/AMP-acid ligase II